MDNMINIGIPSKGRLKKDVLKIFKKKKFNLISERGERDLINVIKNKKNIKNLSIHTSQITDKISDHSIHDGFSEQT